MVGSEGPGLVVKPILGRQRTIAYGEILTAERVRGGRGVRLHTRLSEPIRLMVRNPDRVDLEELLRSHGVRVVDCWGAMITPTFADFEAELSRRSGDVRQSSDSA